MRRMLWGRKGGWRRREGAGLRWEEQEYEGGEDVQEERTCLYNPTYDLRDKLMRCRYHEHLK